MADVQFFMLFLFQISMNVHHLTGAVPTLATTLLARSLVPAQAVSSWILGNEVAKVSLPFSPIV